MSRARRARFRPGLLAIAACAALSPSCKEPKTSRGNVDAIEYGPDAGGAQTGQQQHGTAPGAPGAGAPGNGAPGAGTNNGTTPLVTAGGKPAPPGNTTGAKPPPGGARAGGTGTGSTTGVRPPGSTTGTGSPPTTGGAGSQPQPPTPACTQVVVKSADWHRSTVQCWTRPSGGSEKEEIANGTKGCFETRTPETVQAVRPYRMFHWPQKACWIEEKHLQD